MKAIDLIISGKVQGVFFRENTAKEALRVGARGWVKNKSDGTVEAHVEGEDNAVDAVINFCRKGAGDARVDDILISRAEPESCQTFEVRC